MSIAIPYYTTFTEFLLISIPCQIVMSYIPHILKLIGCCFLKSNYDNANPRLYMASLENEALIGDEVAQFVLRCHACTLNCLEDLLIYAAAPIAILLFSENKLLGFILAWIHLGLRLLYIVLYCFVARQCLSYLRSIVFWLAWACPMIMLFETAHNIGARKTWRIA